MKKVFLLFLFLTGCSISVKPDYDPSPSDLLINQARLEFKGCGRDNQVGTLSCHPGQTAFAITEFPGKLTIASSGANCSFRMDLTVDKNKKETEIPFVYSSDGKSSCAVIVIYLPQISTSSTIPIRSLFGEIVYQADVKYEYQGNVAITDLQPLVLNFPGAVRGAFVSRQFEGVQTFIGDTLSFLPQRTGTDLILIKLWDAGGNFKTVSYTANYYSFRAIALTYAMHKDSAIHLDFPESVSVATANGSIYPQVSMDLYYYFSGYVRAYTAQGRTLVIKFNKGVVEWSK